MTAIVAIVPVLVNRNGSRRRLWCEHVFVWCKPAYARSVRPLVRACGLCQWHVFRYASCPLISERLVSPRSLAERSHVSVLNRFRFRKSRLRPERNVVLWDEDISWRRLDRSWGWLRHINDRKRNDRVAYEGCEGGASPTLVRVLCDFKCGVRFFAIDLLIRIAGSVCHTHVMAQGGLLCSPCATLACNPCTVV